MIPPFAVKHLRVVDPTHPWAKESPAIYLRRLPFFHHAALTIRCIPKGLLGQPQSSWSDPPFTYRSLSASQDPRHVDMSVLFATSKRTFGTAVVSNKIKNKIKSSIAMIVTRGVDVCAVNGKDVLVADEKDAGWTWVMKGKSTQTPRLFHWSSSTADLQSGMHTL